MSAPAAPPAYAPVAEPGAQCNRGAKAEVLRFRASSKGWRAQWETDPPGQESEAP